MQTVLAYYGIAVREDMLAGQLGTTPEAGAPPEAIVRVAATYGLQAEIKENLIIAALAEAVSAGIPVIVAFQAWPQRPRLDFSNVWDEGLYAVVVQVERGWIVFEDPSLLGSRGVMRHAEFEPRWHDMDSRRTYLRMGIFITGRPPSPPQPRLPIE